MTAPVSAITLFGSLFGFLIGFAIASVIWKRQLDKLVTTAVTKDQLAELERALAGVRSNYEQIRAMLRRR